MPARNKTTKYENVIPQIVAAEQNAQVEGVRCLKHGRRRRGSRPGDRRNDRQITKPTVPLVLGGGHSIGVPIAVAADFSFIIETATMTIHPVRLTGLVVGVPQTFEYLEKMQERVVHFVVGHSKIRRISFGS